VLKRALSLLAGITLDDLLASGIEGELPAHENESTVLNSLREGPMALGASLAQTTLRLDLL
jgi:hypothetical protein